MILAIDSGKKSGWALFEGPRGIPHGGIQRIPYWQLLSVGTFNPDKVLWPDAWDTALLGMDDRAVIERPEGRGGKTPAKADSLIALALRAGKVAGACFARGIPTEYVTPVKWKGSMPKDVCHRRIAAVLTERERGILKGVKSKDAWDAVGIGLWAVGRF